MKLLIFAVGNSMRGDDGIASYIVEQINKKLLESSRQGQTGDKVDIYAVDCGTTPENYTSIVSRYKPEKLVLLDAAEMGLAPGSYRIIPPERMGVMTMSTHNIPLSLFVNYLKESCDEIFLLGVQPKNMRMFTELSSEVREAGDELVIMLLNEGIDRIETLNG